MVLQQIAVCQRDLWYIVSVHAKQGRNAEFGDMRSLDLHGIGSEVMRPLSSRDTPLEVHPDFPFLIHVEGVIHHN
ncbi:hypothetical protein BGX34_008128, partial [Mortierella sp. NVP85]